ncbi:hypothetical protein [Mycolicibacterium neworleansense]|uniref:Uncharacterized protein n=1 Tax=Mycolicibacterium neworleansense TaxID=146018 RepID=A0A0H5RW59_9MYCO|nr:hypothetical protein [Mycolicibacterium neworleansense]CRZ17757.1 hypothetical protein BN2156_04649 [Mycolicibacterium neworleansense]
MAGFAADWLAADAAPVPACTPASAPLSAIGISGARPASDEASGAAVIPTGAPAVVTWAAWVASDVCSSVITSAVVAIALLAAAIAAAQPHGKMIIGPMAAIVAANSLMMAMSRTRAWPTLAAAVVKLLLSASDWAPTLAPSETAAVVLAAAAVPEAPCHASPTELTDFCIEPPVESSVFEMAWSIVVGSTPSNMPLPKVPSASVTGLISALGSMGLAGGCCSGCPSGGGSSAGF